MVVNMQFPTVIPKVQNKTYNNKTLSNSIYPKLRKPQKFKRQYNKNLKETSNYTTLVSLSFFLILVIK